MLILFQKYSICNFVILQLNEIDFDYIQLLMSEDRSESKLYLSENVLDDIYNIGDFFSFKSNEYSPISLSNHQFEVKNLIKMTKPTTFLTDKPNLPQKRQVRKIQTNSNCKINYLKTLNGTKDQTVELNINFKTIICKLFKDKIQMKEITSQNIVRVSEFKERRPSFKSLKALLQSNDESDQVRDHLSQFTNSSYIVKAVLQSNANQVNKITMIKFLQVLKKNIQLPNQIIKWKVNKNAYDGQ